MQLKVIFDGLTDIKEVGQKIKDTLQRYVMHQLRPTIGVSNHDSVESTSYCNSVKRIR